MLLTGVVERMVVLNRLVVRGNIPTKEQTLTQHQRSVEFCLIPVVPLSPADSDLGQNCLFPFSRRASFAP